MENAEDIEVEANVRSDDFVAKESSDVNKFDNNSEHGDVSDEVKDILKPFEQTNWDNMPLEQKKEAIEYLRDSVAEDLGLQEKPDVKYYNNEDNGDLGGYSPSENAIYINEHNMGDAKETADTIAYESRHCWQHEMAESSDSSQAQEFRENFDDYIRPEDDYRGYRNQPVEADARDYARKITDNIPEHNDNSVKEDLENSTNANPTGSDIRQNEEWKGAVFDIPNDVELKKEISLDEKLQIANKTIQEINEDPTLGELEKSEKIVAVLKNFGFDKVDVTTVDAFTNRDITLVNFDGSGSQTLYRRSYDGEGSNEHPYGSWWSDHPMSIEEARNGLAILEEWGNPLTGQYESNPTNTLAMVGTAAPQDGRHGEHRDGGEIQYYINSPKKEDCRKVS